MSFYGSVYYQLIDTFYKVAVKNTGATSSSFLTSVNADEELSNQAVGRKGVFGLDSGNKWINFSKHTASDDTATYKIWHGQPDPAGKNPAYGFQKIDKSSLSEAQLKTVKELNHDDYFKTYETVYDAAGHIVSSKEQLYQLPKDVIDDRVNGLLKAVGEPTAGRIDKGGKKEETVLNDLYDYAEENYDDIKALETYVGGVDSVSQYWGEDWAIGKLSIADIIGNLDDVFNNSAKPGGGYSWVTKTNFKSLSEIIGNLYSMYVTLDPENASNPQERSITSAISYIFDYLNNFIANTYSAKVLSLEVGISSVQIALKGLDESLEDTIGELEALSERHDKDIKDLTDKHTNELNSAKNTLDAKDLSLENAISTETNARIAKDNSIDAEIVLLKAEDSSIRNAYATADAQVVENQTKVNSEIRSEYAAADAKIREDFKAADDSLDGKISALDTKTATNLATVVSEQTVKNTAIEKSISDLDTKTATDLQSAIDEQALKNAAIEELIGTNKTAAETALADFETNVIGSVNDDTTVMSEIAKSNENIASNAGDIDNIEKTLGDQGDYDSVYSEIAGIYDAIGTDDKTTTVKGRIKVNENAIDSQNTRLNGIDAAINAQGTTISTLRSALDTVTNSHKTDLENINNILGNTKDILNSNTVAGELISLRSDLTGINQMVDQHDPAITNLQAADKKYDEELQNLSKKFASYLPTDDIANSYLSKEVFGDIAVLGLQDGQTVTTVLSEKLNKVEEMQGKINEFEQIIGSLQEAINNLTARINELHPDNDPQPPVDNPDDPAPEEPEIPENSTPEEPENPESGEVPDVTDPDNSESGEDITEPTPEDETGDTTE